MNNLCKKYQIELNKIEKIEWKTQNTNSRTILFYTMGTGSEAQKVFEKRVNSCDFAYCIVNRKTSVRSQKIINVEANEFLELQKEICDEILPFESNFKSFSVTGTNGKTTTVDLLRQVCLLAGKNVLTIGTLGVWKNSLCVDEFGLTSPTYIDFRKYLSRYSKDIDVLAVEVSSHGLMQDRFYKFNFDFGAWTSFSQDHLDYHKTMDEYFCAKKKIFDCVINTVSLIDTEKFIDRLESPKLKLIKTKNFNGNEFLAVEYNKKNMSLALDLMGSIGVDEKDIPLGKIHAPPGRFNILNYKKGHIVIDFAHTPDALKNICLEIKTSFPDFKLITVFGCGGNRDKVKRPLMGRAAVANSDYVYVTSDNPRFEKPKEIINDIIVGLELNKFEVEPDREAAIMKALSRSEKQIVLIAGKGHENYIDQNGVKRPYSDLEVVKRIIKNDKN